MTQTEQIHHNSTQTEQVEHIITPAEKAAYTISPAEQANHTTTPAEQADHNLKHNTINNNTLTGKITTITNKQLQQLNKLYIPNTAQLTILTHPLTPPTLLHIILLKSLMMT